MRTDELRLGWLSPTGEFIPCETYEHIDTAHKIVHAYRYSNVYDKHYNARPDDECLLHHGWVHISRSLMTKKFRINWNIRKFLTEIQKNFLKKYFDSGVDELSKLHWETENKYDY